jgi:tetratricopeptide (TPR) repeat protein
LKRWDEAVNLYSRVLRLQPPDTNVLLAQSKCYFGLKDFAAAKSLCEMALQLEPDNSVAKENLTIIEKQISAAKSIQLTDAPAVPSDFTTAPENAFSNNGKCELLEMARAAVAEGNIAGAFRSYRQILAASASLDADLKNTLCKELIDLFPRYAAKAQADEVEGFLCALRLHKDLAREFATGIEQRTTREANILSFTLGAAYAGAGLNTEAQSVLRSIAQPEVVSPEFQQACNRLTEVSAPMSRAARAGRTEFLRTPYPLGADGRPKLSPVWFEVTSFCNQKCSFCPDRWRDTKRQFVPLDVFKRYIDELKRDFNVEYLQLNAYGEPLLHPQFEQILTYLREGHSPAPYFFTTHGMTLTERNIAMLDRVHPHGICVSLQNDGPASYAATRNLRIGDYNKMAAQTQRLIERFARNHRACHVRLYQLLSNHRLGYGVPQSVADAFPRDWERFAAAVRRWEQALHPLANGRDIQAICNSDEALRTAFDVADHPAWWVKVPLLRWKDECGGWQEAFISPRPIGTYANQLPYHSEGWTVERRTFNPGSCCFTKNPGLAIFSNGNLGICCLSLNQQASFGRLQDFASLKEAVSSAQCFQLFAELSNGVARSQDCQVCLGEIKQTGTERARCPGAHLTC